MSTKYLGFLVVNPKTGFMAEGKEHAARVFENLLAARQACKPPTPKVPYEITYETLVKSLLSGIGFCFESEATYAKFIKQLSHDMGNRPFLAYSRDKNLVRWRFINDTPQSLKMVAKPS
jgi:hypothetical protein